MTEDLNLQPLLFQTQLFKVVFTTLYVDVKEPAFPAHFGQKKLNPASGLSALPHLKAGQN